MRRLIHYFYCFCLACFLQQKNYKDVKNMTKSILNKIETTLNEDVRPALSEHKGNVAVSDFTDGILRIRLTGMCSGCPSASVTTEELIAEKLKARIPEINEVILCTGVSDELISQAKAMLQHEFPK